MEALVLQVQAMCRIDNPANKKAGLRRLFRLAIKSGISPSCSADC